MAVPVSSLFALRFAKCKHMPAKNKLYWNTCRRTLIEVFEEELGVPKQCTVKIECVLNEEGHSSIYEVLSTLTVREVKENFNFKHVNFRCVESETDSNINHLKKLIY
jgi:hypothetical protein